MTVDLACSHRPPCPGCPRFGAAGLAPSTEERLRSFCADLGLVDVPVRVGKALGYRVRSRLSARGRRGRVELGIFRQGTHELVDIPTCVVHHDSINRAASAVKRAALSVGATPYSDAAHRGLLRAAQFVVERSSRRVQTTLVLNSERFEAGAELSGAVASALGTDLHSLFLNLNPARTNVVLGDRWQLVSGNAAVEESLGGARLFFPPSAFGQANLDLFESIVDDVHEMVPDDARVMEYYAGVGAIGLGLVARSRSYAFNELGSGSLAGLELGLAELSSAEREKTRILRGAAGEYASACLDHDVVIVDPPRKGLDAALLDVLSWDDPRLPERLVYLSCGLDALQRDVLRLTRGGPYRVRGVTAYALFPFTEHAETLWLFRRV